MSRTIHINLLNDSERKGSNPVRFRIIIPTLFTLTLIVLVFSFLAIKLTVRHRLKTVAELENKSESLLEGNKKFEETTARKAQIETELKQLKSYLAARKLFSSCLAHLPEIVPENIQFTSMEIPPPIRNIVVTKRRRRSVAPKEIEEGVTLRIGGVVVSTNTADSSDASLSVETLRRALKTDVFTNFVKQAEIHRGSFRLLPSKDTALHAEKSERQFIFEINCTCTGRMFK